MHKPANPNMHLLPNLSVNTDRLQTALTGSLRRCAAPAAGYLRR